MASTAEPDATELETVEDAFGHAAEVLELPDDVRKRLDMPDRELIAQVPVRMDDGRVEVFSAYRVQHNNSRGPYKGGFRYHPDVDLDGVRALAAAMTWKTALTELPFGGAKGGVNVETKDISSSERQAVTRGLMGPLECVLGPMKDIMAPDMGSGPNEMAWMMDEWSRTRGYAPGVVTGKPVELGGTEGRVEATGYGVALIMRSLVHELGWDMDGLRVAVQGFGNVGSHASQALDRMGCRIVAVSDVYGAYVNDAGLDVAELVRRARRGIIGHEGMDVERASNEELLALDCDVLIPAALGSVLHAGNADSVKAALVVEAANSPTTPGADAIFEERGIRVLPDILANAGGVVVSYLEWIQNIQNVQWSRRQVDDELESRMGAAFEASCFRSHHDGCSLRQAAYRLALERVVEAVGLRGHP